MHRALWEFRIRGVATNLRFLDQIVTHPRFARGQYTTRFIDETPELFATGERRDRATRILTFMAEAVVNGNPEVKGRIRPARLTPVRPPQLPRRPGGRTTRRVQAAPRTVGPRALRAMDARRAARAGH